MSKFNVVRCTRSLVKGLPRPLLTYTVLFVGSSEEAEDYLMENINHPDNVSSEQVEVFLKISKHKKNRKNFTTSSRPGNGSR